MTDMDLTDKQAAAQKALAEAGGNKTEAARLLGVPRTTFRRWLDADSEQIVAHARVTQTSTLYDRDGNVAMQWVKTAPEPVINTADLEEAARAAFLESLPRVEPSRVFPTMVNPDLCNVYTITDYHMGMLAWHREGGADWDTNIASDLLPKAFSALVHNSMPAKTCIINQLGDFLHSDGLLPVTPTSGHILDQDGRFQRIVSRTIKVLRTLISIALAKHNHVHVIMAEGNHDMASSIWLREMFRVVYENEPRVTIDNSALPYYVYQHGKTMLAFHHGHLKKINNLASVFAAQFPKIWGETTCRYAHTGHYHHLRVLEDAGMTVTQHRTLAAKDAYSSRGGYFAERKLDAITYHTEWGEVASNCVSAEMFT